MRSRTADAGASKSVGDAGTRSGFLRAILGKLDAAGERGRNFPADRSALSEGAAYNVGFSHVLKTGHSAIDPEGFVVVSELSWLSEAVPAAVLRFFHTGYPAM